MYVDDIYIDIILINMSRHYVDIFLRNENRQVFGDPVLSVSASSDRSEKWRWWIEKSN